MVATWRWPNASYRVWSIWASDSPSREAVSRSIFTAMCGEAICWSDVTSCRPGSLAMCSSMIGAQWLSSSESVEVMTYWNSVLVSFPPTLMSWPACMKYFTPGITATLGRSRWMIFCAESVRCENGLSWMNMRATFSAPLKPVDPTKPTTPETPGSWLMMAANSFCMLAMP